MKGDDTMSLNKKCPTCGQVGTLTLRHTDATSCVGANRFVMEVPAWVCGVCDEAIFSSETLSAMERAVTRELIASGAQDPAALRWLRKAAELPGAELARLLGVAAETVSRWENGVQTPDRATVAVVAELALDALEGRIDTRSRLDRMAHATPRSPDANPSRLVLSGERAA